MISRQNGVQSFLTAHPGWPSGPGHHPWQAIWLQTWWASPRLAVSTQHQILSEEPVLSHAHSNSPPWHLMSSCSIAKMIGTPNFESSPILQSYKDWSELASCFPGCPSTASFCVPHSPTVTVYRPDLSPLPFIHQIPSVWKFKQAQLVEHQWYFLPRVPNPVPAHPQFISHSLYNNATPRVLLISF